jgi:hypothetical protein
VTRLWAGGLALVVGAEVLAVVLGANRWLLPAAGAAAALVLIAARMSLDGRHRVPSEAITDEAAESLQRWKSRTESTIQWADATRADWDRHLRPKLAAEFILATRHKDPNALKATGRIVFGEELWRWVDPSDISRTGSREPGPGSATLEEILRRMERL